MNSSKEGCGTIVFTLAMVPALILANAWVTLKLWGWFVVPLGVPAIGMAHAYGLGVIMNLIRFSAPLKKDTREDNPAWLIAAIGLLTPAVLLGVGYVTHLVMGH